MTSNDWNNINACYNNASILWKVGMPEAAANWTARAEELCIGGGGAKTDFAELLRANPAGRA